MTNLPRTLGLRDLILLTIGSVIGSGIFLVPGAVLRQVDGFILPALLVWLIGGIVSLLGALTYGELGAMKPAGGRSLYIHSRLLRQISRVPLRLDTFLRHQQRRGSYPGRCIQRLPW
jgi:amino acid permease